MTTEDKRIAKFIKERHKAGDSLSDIARNLKGQCSFKQILSILEEEKVDITGEDEEMAKWVSFIFDFQSKKQKNLGKDLFLFTLKNILI